MTRSERGSATLHSLFAAVLILTALTAAILWSAISTARHKLAAAADLTALSAARFLTDPPAATTGPNPTPCAAAVRVAVLNDVQLTECAISAGSVTVEVSVSLDLRVARPTLTAAARAGPV
ncbi:Rv3654c family TadE-like protein [Kribbella sp. NPDC048915]|uniref:Rv3654c family TadE-like protein n=1 Tax=Kribbella sp. NPDC048915 TaxID=3155148 RepID=UPI0033D137D0